MNWMRLRNSPSLNFFAVNRTEVRTRRLEFHDAIDGEDGQEVFAPIRQIGDEIEIILGEHDGGKIHLMCALCDVLTAVGDAYGMVWYAVPSCAARIPKSQRGIFPVAQRDIVMLLTADQLPYLCAIPDAVCCSSFFRKVSSSSISR